MKTEQEIKKMMEEKIRKLDEAARVYYSESGEIMSNFEYDSIYDELETLEKESGIILPQSPTTKVGYEAKSALPKERHPQKMLSLAKTKSREELKDWLGDKKGLLSWKMDGLTVVITYESGRLKKAVTRGNGEIGEVITENAKTFVNLPKEIEYKGLLSFRGEAVITYGDFEKTNSEIPELDAKYKNPRNLCSGSVRQLDAKITASRRVRLFAFSMVSCEGVDFKNSMKNQFDWLKNQGFDVVEYVCVTSGNVIEELENFEKRISGNEVPSDGLVLAYDDLEYGRSLGETAKFPRSAIAFKWEDATADTELIEVEWSASRTGLINPIAVFEPVELEGTTVTRASLHNLSIMKKLKLGIGDTIRVYKANMIIPQVAENLTKSDTIHPPEICPICGSRTEIEDNNGIETLICANRDCPAKHLKKMELFASRDALNIEGLSVKTIEKFVSMGIVKEATDFFKLSDFRDRIIYEEGFGEKSYENLISAIDNARETSPERVLYALGIKGIGIANAKMISRHFHGDFDKMIHAKRDELIEIDGVGEVMADDYVSFFCDERNLAQVKTLLSLITIKNEDMGNAQTLTGKTFVITGSLANYKNRDELKREIEASGGKVTSSVSAKTDFLINNDIESLSSKNKRAKQLGIPIINEEQIQALIKNGVA